MGSNENGHTETAARSTSTLPLKNVILWNAVTLAALTAGNFLHECNLQDATLDPERKDGVNETSPKENEEPKAALDRHICACVHLCNAQDALLLCNACYARPLCPYRLHAAAQQLSSKDARSHLISIARILESHASLGQDAAHSVQSSMSRVSFPGYLASATIPMDDPAWSDREVISSTAAKFLELHEARQATELGLSK